MDVLPKTYLNVFPLTLTLTLTLIFPDRNFNPNPKAQKLLGKTK